MFQRLQVLKVYICTAALLLEYIYFLANYGFYMVLQAGNGFPLMLWEFGEYAWDRSSERQERCISSHLLAVRFTGTWDPKSM